MPKIRISTRQGDALRDMRILVCVDEWDVHSAYPSGHYVRTLGPIGDRETETQVVLIEHDMSVVMDISDRVVVLDYGKKIGDGTPEEVRNNEEVISAYLGTSH